MTAISANRKLVESGRGQPQSKTLARSLTCHSVREVVECGCPLPLCTIPDGQQFQSHSGLLQFFLLCVFLVFGAAQIAIASTPLTVAVYDFVDSTNNKAALGGKITALVTADLSLETNLVMVERVQLSKSLSEQAFGVSGLVSSDAAARIGQITGAKVVVAGQAIRTEGSHLVIIATIIGTETGRLFAAKIEGPAGHLTDLTADLSKKIAGTIDSQAGALVAAAAESKADRFARIVKSIKGTNRPSASVSILRGGGNRVWRPFAESRLSRCGH
jgi:TolB-like protein